MVESCAALVAGRVVRRNLQALSAQIPCPGREVPELYQALLMNWFDNFRPDLEIDCETEPLDTLLPIQKMAECLTIILQI
jgi:hypothetical protein